MNNILSSTSSYTSSYMIRVEELEISPEEQDPRMQQSTMQLCSAYNPNSSSFNYSPIEQHNLDLLYPQVSPNNNPFPLPINYASDQYDLLLVPVAPNIDHSSQLGLELGHHRPFYPSTESSWALAQFFKSRGCYYEFGTGQPPRCQAEGCKADLTSAKRYHRRHKVCEPHSKASVVHLGGGIMQRFCQQCSRFHMLDEFDDMKKSCRKRLADHNRRRRKPKPDSPVPSTQAKVVEQQNALLSQANSENIPREKEVQKVPNSKGKAINTRGWLHASICSSKSISGPSSGA